MSRQKSQTTFRENSEDHPGLEHIPTQKLEPDFASRSFPGHGRDSVPVQFKNILPYPVTVSRWDPETGSSTLVFIVRPNSAQVLDQYGPEDEFLFHLPIPRAGGPAAFSEESMGRFTMALLKTQRLSPFTSTVEIGSIQYDEYTADLTYHNISSDISGVRIFNHLPLQLQVYYGGRLVARVNPKVQGSISTRDGYLGGSSNSVYFDNSGGQGLFVGDELTFRLGGKPYATVKLVDQFGKHIHVGLITDRYPQPPPPDMHTYALDTEPITGLTFYRPQHPGPEYLKKQQRTPALPARASFGWLFSRGGSKRSGQPRMAYAKSSDGYVLGTLGGQGPAYSWEKTNPYAFF